MMKILFSCLLLFTSISCQSANQKTVAQFKEINYSLENYSALTKTYNDIAELIRKETHDEAILKQTEAILLLTKQNLDFLAHLKVLLQQKDTSGMGTTASGALLVATPTATKLKNSILNLYDTFRLCLHEPSQIKKLDSLLPMALDIKNNPGWDKKWFDQIPTVAAITLLNKLETDHKRAAAFVLTELSNKGKK
ncbi:hypothetical protein DBR32_11665 [Taibaiella sp. KBW10]|uniref:hypothetical protein n=1 Tax=Taibaiella sp. KBW10 TaxID=2153357 RepID=UPI000F5A82F6|nr:hypothetical protein [Taibaiella sp. KBW10]RQO30228.1 hypothetical protein DBR32_11665 [Taibaiella sp. KBW10]